MAQAKAIGKSEKLSIFFADILIDLVE